MEFRLLAVPIFFFFYKFKTHIGLKVSSSIYFYTRDMDTDVSKINVNAKRPSETMIQCYVLIVIKRISKLKNHHLR